MYRKGKSHEINDIIYSADATADYSHTNKYYEEVYDNKKSFINDNTGNINTSIPTSTSTPTPTSTSTNTFTNNRFRQNNDNKLIIYENIQYMIFVLLSGFEPETYVA